MQLTCSKVCTVVYTTALRLCVHVFLCVRMLISHVWSNSVSWYHQLYSESTTVQRMLIDYTIAVLASSCTVCWATRTIGFALSYLANELLTSSQVTAISSVFHAAGIKLKSELNSYCLPKNYIAYNANVPYFIRLASQRVFQWYKKHWTRTEVNPTLLRALMTSQCQQTLLPKNVIIYHYTSVATCREMLRAHDISRTCELPSITMGSGMQLQLMAIRDLITSTKPNTEVNIFTSPQSITAANQADITRTLCIILQVSWDSMCLLEVIKAPTQFSQLNQDFVFVMDHLDIIIYM